VCLGRCTAPPSGGGGGTLLFVPIRVELRPVAFKETPHGVASRPHLRRVLVEQLAVVEDEMSVRRKLLTAAVPETRKRRRKKEKKVSQESLLDELGKVAAYERTYRSGCHRTESYSHMWVGAVFFKTISYYYYIDIYLFFIFIRYIYNNK